jgi:pSer/pThr/pTyr-binding forkhead associated (FHA) protein
MSKIEQFENVAARLVEGTFARLFAGRLSPLKVAAHLERAIEEHQICVPGGPAQAPTHYWIYLNPRDYQSLAGSGNAGEEQSAAEQALAPHIAELISQADLALDAPPVVHIEHDENVSPRDVRVEARWIHPDSDQVERTREMATMARPDDQETGPQPPPGRPFLIVEGNRHINLTDPVVSVGRALDNDVIIEDPRISRRHAQIRQRYGHYVLYDLDSTGGTKINGYPVQECMLHSGDVISLAGVEVIFGEDPPTPIPLPATEHTPTLSEAESEV